jgi:hypothetical protein
MNSHESVVATRAAIRKHLRSLAIEMEDTQGKTIRAATSDCDGLTLVFTNGTYANIQGGGFGESVYDGELVITDAVKLNLVPPDLLLAFRHAEERQRRGDKEYTGHRALEEAVQKLGHDKVVELLKEANTNE